MSYHACALISPSATIANTPARTPTLRIAPATVTELAGQRRDHFCRLNQPPELYLELMVPSCQAYALFASGEPAGHLLVTPEGTLVELALTALGCRYRQELFADACQTLKVRHVLCYSFDSNLIGLCVESGAVANPHGVLWREFVPGHFAALPQLRPAHESDILRILPHREHVFDTDEQVIRWVRGGWVYVLEEQQEFVGLGLCSPVWPDSPQRDIGVMVHPAKRRVGYGRLILASLAEQCIRSGLVPTAGCAHDNLASRRALLGAGFISRHSLIQFELGVAGIGSGEPKLDEVAHSLSGDARLLAHLPELLQDLWALGLGTEPTLRLLTHAGLDKRTDLRVLDLACGKGEALVVLAERFGWRGTGVDLMPAFVNEGRLRAADHEVSDLVQLQVGDLAEAAVSGEPVDLILFGMDSNALGGLADALRAMQERLTPTGHVVLSTVWGCAGRPPVENVLSESETRQAVQAAGLDIAGEELLTVNWVRARNESNTAQIRHRASELARRYPDKQTLFYEYVKAQEDESRQLEEELVCAVLLLRKAS